MKPRDMPTSATRIATLQVLGLSLHVGGRPLIEGLSFEAHAGERWCVIGRNAAGKSSLLRALAGLGLRPQAGSIALQGDAQALASGARAARLRAYLPQSPRDRFELTVRELLDLHGAAGAGQGDSALLAAAARDLDITVLLDRAVTQLSGGERQRVGLAAVAVQGVPLWLLDEPVSFQDPAHQRSVAQWLCRQPERAVVLSAHDMAWVQQCATHVIALLGDGAWRAGSVAEVLSAQTLADTFGCPWRQIDGIWFTDR